MLHRTGLVCLLTAALTASALLASGCADSAAPDPSTTSSADSQEVELDIDLTALRTQVTAAKADGAWSDGETLTGTLAFLTGPGDLAERFDVNVSLNPDTWDVAIDRAVLIAPGDYEVRLIVSHAKQYYFGYTQGVVVRDGPVEVPLTIRPLIGTTTMETEVTREIADFELSYPAETLAQMDDPRIGISVDGEPQSIFLMNPATGLSDFYVTLQEGEHRIALALYDGSTQVGRSVAAHETQYVVPGLDIAIDIEPVYGTTRFTLEEEGSAAHFALEFPAAVVDEVGGIDNLQAVVTIAGPKTTARETTLLMAPFDGENARGFAHFDDMQFDTVATYVALYDTSKAPAELVAACATTVELSTLPSPQSCDLTLRRRAIVGGAFVSAMGFTVFDAEGAPAAGAILVVEGEAIAVTSNGTMQPAGHAKANLAPGTWDIEARDATGATVGRTSVTVEPLGIYNTEIHMALPASGIDCARWQAAGFVTDGIYSRDPFGDHEPRNDYATWCEMGYDGGGWTLATVHSDDGVNTWTHDERSRMTDRAGFGDITDRRSDYKSQAAFDLPFTDILVVHQPSGKWASYRDVGTGTVGLATFFDDYGSDVCWQPDGGFEMSAGTLTVAGALCDTDLYINAADQDGKLGCDCVYCDDDAFGLSWNVSSNNSCNFDDPGEMGSLGPNADSETGDREHAGLGFGWALGLNSGAPGQGENYVQVYVR